MQHEQRLQSISAPAAAAAAARTRTVVKVTPIVDAS